MRTGYRRYTRCRNPSSGLRCFRCGRNSHFANTCFAKTHFSGLPLKPKFWIRTSALEPVALPALGRSPSYEPTCAGSPTTYSAPEIANWINVQAASFPRNTSAWNRYLLEWTTKRPYVTWVTWYSTDRTSGNKNKTQRFANRCMFDRHPKLRSQYLLIS